MMEFQTFEVNLKSQLQTIEKCAFYMSSVEKIEIPASLTNLENGWCQETKKLKEVEVNSSNPKYKNYDRNIVVGKSTIEMDDFDVLVFCNRKIKSITIPNFIQKVGPFSFDNCQILHKVEIDIKKSKLQTIEEYAFRETKIESITFPPHLIKIGQSAFEFCRELQKVEIQRDSEILIIERNAFGSTKIESILIPLHLTKISEGTFNLCHELRNVEIPNDSEL